MFSGARRTWTWSSWEGQRLTLLSWALRDSRMQERRVVIGSIELLNFIDQINANSSSLLVEVKRDLLKFQLY